MAYTPLPTATILITTVPNRPWPTARRKPCWFPLRSSRRQPGQFESRLGPSAELAFLQAIHQGELTRIDLTTEDWARVIDLVEQYADLGLGTVDASIGAMAERLEIDVIATLNRRDFAIVRARSCLGFRADPLTVSVTWSQTATGSLSIEARARSLISLLPNLLPNVA